MISEEIKIKTYWGFDIQTEYPPKIVWYAFTLRITASDFMLAGKSLSTSFVGVTLFATWFGSSQIMGTPHNFIENGLSSFVTLIVA